MAGTATNPNTTATILSLCSTTSDNLKNVVIKNGQLIFMHDVGRIAMDLHGKRTFYNQIIELDAEQERLDLTDAVNGKYYFVIETAILWRYFNGWTQLTSSPDEILFIGTEIPELGQPKTLYVNKLDREISVWDEDTSDYVAVSNYTEDATAQDIERLFKTSQIINN